MCLLNAIKTMKPFYDDVVAAYRKALQCFYDLGCRNIQLDDTSWGEFCALDKREA